MTQDEEAAYHEAGHAVMALRLGMLIEYVDINRGPGAQVGGTRLLQDPGPLAPPDGSVNLKMVMFSVAGAIAEELVTGVGYGSDGQNKSDHEQAVEWASRGGELLEGPATRATRERSWAQAESELKAHWSWVVAVAETLRVRKRLTGSEVLSLLIDRQAVPYAGLPGRSSSVM